MTPETRYLELRCGACSWTELCGPDAMAAWLRKARKLRADSEPELEIMVELLPAAAPRLACPQCGQLGLTASPAADDAEWPEPALCESCSKPIPPERLEAVPDATLCAVCQEQEELGQAETDTEYCPKCGAPMEVRLSRSPGLARYVSVCTANTCGTNVRNRL